MSMAVARPKRAMLGSFCALRNSTAFNALNIVGLKPAGKRYTSYSALIRIGRLNAGFNVFYNRYIR